jgi:hypothetical protein
MDLGDLLHPPAAEAMIQVQDRFRLPVKIIGDIGYLLVELVQRVAGYPPSLARSTSNVFSQWGQVYSRRVLPFSLIWR